MASDLGESRIADDGSIHPGVLDGGEEVSDSTITRRGGLGAAIYPQRLLAADELPLFETLVEMDQHQFQDPYRAQLHYALSSFWVRYLVSDFDSGLQAGFRSFLGQVAAGQPITEESLLAALETDWQSLETGFRNWLRLQFVTPPNEARPESP